MTATARFERTTEAPAFYCGTYRDTPLSPYTYLAIQYQPWGNVFLWEMDRDNDTIRALECIIKDRRTSIEETHEVVLKHLNSMNGDKEQ